MKRPSVDISQRTLAKYTQERGYLNKFVRYWGTTWVNGEEVLIPRNYYYNGTQTPYKSVLEEKCTGDAPGGMPLPCTRERKLFEFLNVWEDLRDGEKDGIENAWLYLNSSKDAEFQDDLLVQNFNKFLETVIDKNGRILLKVRIPVDGIYIPGMGIVNTEGSLQIPYYHQYETVEEQVYLLDEEGNTVLKEVLVQDAQGNWVGTGNYESVKTTQKVRSYSRMKDALRDPSNGVWNKFIVLPVRADRFQIFDSSKTDSLKMLQDLKRDPFEELLSRYALFYFDSDQIRISNVIKSVIRQEIPWEATEDGFYLSTSAKSVGVDGIEYDHRKNTMTITSQVYEVTYVVSNSGVVDLTLESPIVKKIIEDIKKDFSRDVYDSNGNPETELNTYKVNSNINSYYTKLVAKKVLFKNNYGDGDIAEVVTSFFYNTDNPSPAIPDWWVHYNGRYYLKKEVLTTNKYIKDRKNRIELLNSLIDSDYEEEDAGWFSFIIIVIAVVAAYFTGGASLALIAQAVVVFALVISVGIYLAQSMGYYGDVIWLSKFNKSISPIVIIASIISLYFAYQSLLREGLQTAVSLTVREMVERIVEWALEKIVNMSFKQALSLVNNIFDFYAKNEMKKSSETIQAKQKELEAMAEAKEQGKFSDIVKDTLEAMLSPLAMINSNYAFDRPYEPSVSKYHSGCSCRTTILGLYGEGARTYVGNVV